MAAGRPARGPQAEAQGAAMPEEGKGARRIASLGECMVELSEARELGPAVLRRAFAGDTLNTAVHLARCLRRQREGAGWSVAYATRLGDDALSAEMLAEWQSEGIDTSLVRRDAGALPGLYMIRTDSAGERRFSYWRENAPARRLFTAPDEAEVRASLAGFDMLYFSGVTVAILPVVGRERLIELARAVRRRGGRVAFDGNYRPLLWASKGEAAEWIAAAYATADIALPSVEEKDLFGCPTAGALADRLQAEGAAEVVVKQGSGPCLLRGRDGRAEVPSGPALRVVDTTGAGDSFNAAYLAARLTGAPPVPAARFGHRLAAQQIAAPGAILPISALTIGPWQELE